MDTITIYRKIQMTRVVYYFYQLIIKLCLTLSHMEIILNNTR